MAVMRRSLRERIYLTFRLVILANCFGEKNILRKKNMEGKVIVLVREKKKNEICSSYISANISAMVYCKMFRNVG